MAFNTGTRHKSLILALILLLFITQVYDLGGFSFGMDEVNSYINSLNQETMWEGLDQSGGNRVLFYLVLNRWLTLGDQILWQRLLSSLTAVLVFPFVYLLGRRISSPTVGVLAVLFLGVNQYFLSLTRFSRNYSLAVLFSVLGVYLLIRALDKGERWAWILYGIVNVLLVLSHPIGIYILIAHAALVLFYPKPIPWTPLVIAGSSVIGAVACLNLFFGQLPLNQIDWLPLPDLNHLFVTFLILMGGNALLLLVYFLFYLFGAVLVLPRYIKAFDRSKEWPFLLVMSWVCVPILAMLATTYLYQPIFEPRYLIMVLPAIALVSARLLLALPARPLRLLFGCGLAFLLIAGSVGRIQDPENPEWVDATSWIMGEGDQRDAVIFFDYHIQRVFRFYAERLPSDRDRPVIEEIASIPYFPGGGSRPSPHDLDKVDRFPEEYEEIWLVLYHLSVHGEHSQTVLNALQADLEEAYWPVETRTYSGLRVIRYQLK